MAGAPTWLAVAALLSSSATQAAVDPANPTCPKELNVSANKTMQLTLREEGGLRILLAEGAIDSGLPARLQAALKKHEPIDQIWLRSPGGDARAGTEAGKLIRQSLAFTRIPDGWACFSACNFVFMGGRGRMIDPGGLFVVHMFTHTSDRGAIEAEVLRGTESTVGLIGDIEQDSAMLASEDNDFLIRMGVSRKLLTDVMYRQKAVKEQGGDGSTRRCLSQEEVFLYKVANVRPEAK
ncbi:MAG TPA: hypothetical protein VFQ67_13195 [Allosphingosinicella sp.]|jgi:hypothetical protein|nr:hypothetical protein [Allosphingosinicella sp.]